MTLCNVSWTPNSEINHSCVSPRMSGLEYITNFQCVLMRLFRNENIANIQLTIITFTFVHLSPVHWHNQERKLLPLPFNIVDTVLSWAYEVINEQSCKVLIETTMVFSQILVGLHRLHFFVNDNM